MTVESAFNEVEKATSVLNMCSHVFADAKWRYDQARHADRTKCYIEKSSGIRKYTEEEIRSITIAKTEELNKSFLVAEADLEAARAYLQLANMKLNLVVSGFLVDGDVAPKTAKSPKIKGA